MMLDLGNKKFSLAPGDTFFPLSQLSLQEYLSPVNATASYQFSENVQKALETNAQKQRLGNVLQPFSAMCTKCPGKTNVLMHRIDTEDAWPKRINLRPLSVHKKALLDVALQEMIETGVVRKSYSPWAFPIVLEPKKDGTAQLCVDFRGINAITVRDSYPVPSVDSIMYHLETAAVFAALN